MEASADRRTPGPPILASLATAALAYSFMQTLVLPALPAFEEEFDASPTAAAWIVSGFFLSSSICIPIFGRLGDALGKVRVLTAVMVVLGLATLGAAFAPTLEVLIACRVLQGVAGSVFPLTFGIVREQLPPERIGFGIGVVSAIFGIGSGFGYVMSGVVLEVLDTQWLFLLALIPVGLAIALVPRLPESPELAPGRPDWLGGLLLAVGLLALLVGLTEGKEWGWTSPAIVGLFGGGLLVLWLWTRWERRVEYPMVDMEMLRRPAVALLNFSTFLVGYAMFAVYTILPSFVAADPKVAGHGFLASPVEIGLFLLPVALAMLVGGPPAGGARQITPINVLRLGVGAMTLSLALIALRPRPALDAVPLARPPGTRHRRVPRRPRAAGGRGGPSRPDRNSRRHQHPHAYGRRRCARPGQRRDRRRLRSPRRRSGGARATRSPSASPRCVALPPSCRRSRWLARGSAGRSEFAQYQPTNRLP